ncbi:hypothetical protein DFJ74DRAFT_532043 [Hyaloraphidium curvatum]|nr:hypothetical protein DFJ74DRAFT_532043 [Hyaloraphidium curvatum]
MSESFPQYPDADDAEDGSDRSAESPVDEAYQDYLEGLANPAKIRLLDSDGSVINASDDSPSEAAEDEGRPPKEEGPTRPLRLEPGDAWDVGEDFWEFDPRKHAAAREHRLEVLRATTGTAVELGGAGIGRTSAKHLALELAMSRNIGKVDISSCNIRTAGCLLLAEAIKSNPSLPLRMLDIRDNDITDEGSKALCDALAGRATLREIRFGNNGISVAGLHDFAELAITIPNLEVFDADSTELPVWDENGDPHIVEPEEGEWLEPRPAAVAVARLLASNPGLRELGLDSCELIWGETAAILEAALVHRSLRGLRLGKNRISSGGARSLAELFAAPDCRLVSLALNSTRLGGCAARIIAKAALANESLTSLDLGSANIGMRGAKAVARLVECNQRLNKLCLEGYKEGGSDGLSPDAVRKLSRALQLGATALEELRVGWNQLRDEGAESIALALEHCPKLKVLNLNQARIGDRGAKALATVLSGRDDRRMLSGSHLESLALRDNEIGSTGGEALADALPRNRTLLELDLAATAFARRELSGLALHSGAMPSSASSFWTETALVPAGQPRWRPHWPSTQASRPSPSAGTRSAPTARRPSRRGWPATAAC